MILFRVLDSISYLVIAVGVGYLVSNRLDAQRADLERLDTLREKLAASDAELRTKCRECWALLEKVAMTKRDAVADADRVSNDHRVEVASLYADIDALRTDIAAKEDAIAAMDRSRERDQRVIADYAGALRTAQAAALSAKKPRARKAVKA